MFRVSFARLDQDRGDQNKGYDLTKLGFPASWRHRFREGHSSVCIAISDYQTLGQYPTGSITNSVSLQPNVRPYRGAHS
jgi:hypothetical protein